MNTALSRSVPHLFAVFCLGCAFLALPAHPALAGETIVYDGTDPTMLQYDLWGIADSLFPGTTLNPGLSGNSVTVNGDGANNVFGGVSVDPGANVTNNRVFINSGTVGQDVYGGSSFSGNATGNSVTISGGTMEFVNGGYSFFGDATGNSVTISGGTMNYVYGGNSLIGAATGNSVTISGGTMNYVYGGNSYIGDATGNSVTISGGTVNGNVYGGNSWSGNATGNSVTISGGEVGQNVYGGYSDSDAATGNSVTISGGEIGQDGEVGQDGYGVYGGASLIGDTTYNTVTISGSPTFGPTTNLWGGKSDGDDSFTGNTLNVWNYRGSSVPGVQHFQYYNFILPASLKGLEVTGTVDFSGPGGATSTVTGVSIMGGGRAPQVGKSISLIHADAGLQGGTITNNGAILAGKKGATLNLSFRLDQQANDLYAVVERVRAAPETKVLSEGFLSGVALVNQGADLAAGQGMAEAVRASMESKYGLGVFAAFSGGWSRYDTGSHTDLSSISLLAGVSKGIDLTPGRLTLGLFFEYGNGSYDTSNSFSGINADGDGDIDHIGGGIIGRMDFANAGPGHVYTEASLRAGSVSNEYRNAHLRDSLGRHASYDADSAYYGLHLGVGYIWNVNDKAALDLYGKYFWTRVQGDDVILSTGDPVGFDGVDSHRLRIGTRFSYAADTRFTPYAGVAYEHEFDGKAAATTYGYAIDEPDLQGGTGVGEIGLKLKPAQDLSLDLGVQGYVGTREGVSGSLRIKYEF